ncbi:MAG: hypothetical protein DMF28_10185 [Verrucomicrobia bacterium]|nr:MAG: hypothetical protein DMF28_10185 [Verrucomicrobiota bacterium]
MKEAIKAVDDENLFELLRSLGLLEQLEKSRITCAVCGDVITAESLQAIIPRGDAVDVICWKPECIHTTVRQYQ